jgi:hypothetical protein
MLRTAVISVGLGLLVSGCAGQGLGRDELERRYVDGLIEGGVEEDVAECVIARLFDELDDADLKAFNTSGTELTDEQRARVAKLSVDCMSV